MENTELKKKIIDLLFPEELPSIESIEKKYPPRNLPAGAMVTRIAPSPTGFMHLGTIYASLISERFAHQTGGVFFVRIEDTDRKREVEGAIKIVTASLEKYGIRTDEGENAQGEEIGNYGPYKQSMRESIYKAFVKMMVEKGMAYPCFASGEELEEMRSEQEAQKIRPGYYREWAKWRDRSDEEVLKMLEEKKPFVIRYKSHGNFDNKIKVTDLLLGKRELSENDQDIIILKSDNLPTYHMAHIIDDHLMGTTHVIRGNEWVASLTLHIQLFEAFAWPAPKFGHIAPIQKMDEGSKRKLSKRKDKEANIEYFTQEGYPENAIIEYLLNLANSDFEQWRKDNPDTDNREFKLNFERLSNSTGPLFDFEKLNNISKELISRYSASDVYARSSEWAKKYDTELLDLLESNEDYAKKILNIERENAAKPRKDIAKWSDIRNEIIYFFDDRFALNQNEALELIGLEANTIKEVIDSFKANYNESDDRDSWFAKLKENAEAHGFAVNMKDYKKNPENYKGSVADVAKIFRVLLTGRTQTPDLHSVMGVMGKDRVFARLDLFN